MNPDRQLTVGIVCNEFFDLKLGRMGGFGWAARRSAECLVERPKLRYRPLLLAGRGGLADDQTARRSNGISLVKYTDDRARYAKTLARAHVSLFLTIDHRPNYIPVLETRPETPVIVWVRDPRTPDDVEKIATLEIPLSGGEPPLGVQSIDCRSLGTFVEEAKAAGSRVVFASPAPCFLAPKASATYGIASAQLAFMPNPLDVVPGRVRKESRPRVVFLGRLDPIKRPWVFVELARRLPHVEFLMLGQSHFTGSGSWQPSRLPANLRLLGHVDGDAKRGLLRSAWMIVNTSIHESLPISFLDALHSATPIVSCQDPERVTSRFGVFVGRWDGSGLEALGALSEAVERLVEDHSLRVRLGREGRAWARSTHTRQQFVSAFVRLADPIVHQGD